MGVVSDLITDVEIPRMVKVRQKFERPIIADIHGTVRVQLMQDKIQSTVKPGMKIAVTSGSRGIANIAAITKEIVDFLKEKAAEPFIVPAMGSHGGATAAGQAEVLESYNITEATMGVPIVSCVEVTKIAEFDNNTPIYIDKKASEADGIVVVNRVKLHTAYRGKYQSGLMKMMVVGLGKQIGADICHAEGFGEVAWKVEAFGNAILKNAKILFGVAIIENAFDETCDIVALTPKEIPEKEPALLEKSEKLMAKIRVPQCDILIIDKIGKNISGDGADPNITGAFGTPFATGGIKSRRIVILDLTDETHGNALGIGMASTTTRRLFEKMDFEKTYPNSITSTIIEGVRIPFVGKNQKEAIQCAIKTTCGAETNDAKIIRIQDTAHVEYIWISEALIEEARNDPLLEILEEPAKPAFDKNGDLF
jgi:hypothetical protein